MNDVKKIEPMRVRFAPSPTGITHLGSGRTALYNYLLAQQTGGQFLLRIEDTDQKRYDPEAEEDLIGGLHWLGLQWDEGPDIGGPHEPGGMFVVPDPCMGAELGQRVTGPAIYDQFRIH